MGSWQTNYPVKVWVCGHESTDLGFFAAHYIRRCILLNSRQNIHVYPRVSCFNLHRLRHSRGTARNTNIRGFCPPLPRTSHATTNDIQGFVIGQKWVCKLNEFRLKFISCKTGHTAIAKLPPDDFAIGTHAPNPKTGCPPICCKPVWLRYTHILHQPVTTTPTSTTMACPVIIWLAFEAKNNVASTISEGDKGLFKH